MGLRGCAVTLSPLACTGRRGPFCHRSPSADRAFVPSVLVHGGMLLPGVCRVPAHTVVKRLVLGQGCHT